MGAPARRPRCQRKSAIMLIAPAMVTQRTRQLRHALAPRPRTLVLTRQASPPECGEQPQAFGCNLMSRRLPAVAPPRQHFDDAGRALPEVWHVRAALAQRRRDVLGGDLVPRQQRRRAAPVERLLRHGREQHAAAVDGRGAQAAQRLCKVVKRSENDDLGGLWLKSRRFRRSACASCLSC